ncbi:MAG: sigma-70 family RNA polymerase sigma factor [Caldilineaceae bacterium]
MYSSARQEPDALHDTLELLDPDFDIEIELERTELIVLLDRALGLLPQEARTALVQKYVDELPTAEIAAHLGVNENAVAARLHRGKLAFRRILATELQDTAIEYGLLRSQQEGWEPTRLWCLACGAQRLEGRFQKDASIPLFALRCPVCDSNDVSAQADLAIPFYTDLLGKFKTYKPAYKQLLVAMGDYCRQALQTQQSPCLLCGAETVISVGKRHRDKTDQPWDYEVLIRCTHCPWATNNSLSSLALSLPEIQTLWLTAPHMHILPTQEIAVAEQAALLVPIRSGADTPGKDLIFVRDTFELIGIYPASTG